MHFGDWQTNIWTAPTRKGAFTVASKMTWRDNCITVYKAPVDNNCFQSVTFCTHISVRAGSADFDNWRFMTKGVWRRWWRHGLNTSGRLLGLISPGLLLIIIKITDRLCGFSELNNDKCIQTGHTRLHGWSRNASVLSADIGFVNDIEFFGSWGSVPLKTAK